MTYSRKYVIIAFPLRKGEAHPRAHGRTRMQLVAFDDRSIELYLGIPAILCLDFVLEQVVIRWLAVIVHKALLIVFTDRRVRPWKRRPVQGIATAKYGVHQLPGAASQDTAENPRKLAKKETV